MYHLQSLIFTVLMALVIALPLQIVITIPEAFLEGDSDSGGESEVGNTAVSVANGLVVGSVGAGSAALNNKSSGSTATVCTMFGCAAAAQSDGNVSTTTSGSNIHASGPIINILGPIIVLSKAWSRQNQSTTAT
jgi:hypothetical protein